MEGTNSSLTDLGVNVYDQDELEADIMRQLDEVAAQQATEQRIKFTEKELKQIQRDTRGLRGDLTSLTRQINSLLSRSLPDVVLQLQDLKKSRDEKRQKLEELEKREKELAKALSTGDFSHLSQPLQAEKLFNLPSSSSSSSSTDALIRSGLLTPFGTTPTLLTERKSAPRDSHVTRRSSSSPAVCSLADFDWLGPPKDDNDSNKSEAVKNKVVTDAASSSSGSTTVENTSRLLALKNEETMEEQGDKEGEGTMRRERAESTPATTSRGGGESDDSSSYLTDEELGVSKKRRKRALDEEESEDELIQTNWYGKRKRGGRGGSKGRQTTGDDGDDKIYKARMREYRERFGDGEEAAVIVEDGFKVPSDIWYKLYRYQQTGVKWLWELHSQQAGGIMGDEMGLGKTIEMIAFLAGLKISNVRSHVTRELGLGPILVVCPATVLQQWVSEFHKWYPPFRVAILHDTGSYGGSRASLLKRMVSANGVMVTTYASVRLNTELLLKHQWEYVILDEGHKIRNPDAEITLACKQFATPHRIILSGSPVQNNLKELWSLFDFVYPGKLGTLPVFLEQFSVPITLGGYASASQTQVETAYRCACILRDTINPYLLRRLKSDVKLQLPNKNEQVLFCRLTDYQRELYEEYIKGPEVEAMMRGGKQIFSGLITLRKLCNHPDLVTKEYQRERAMTDSETSRGGDKESITEEEDDDDNDDIIQLSSKRLKLEEGFRDDEEESYGFWRRSGKMIVIESLLKMWHEQKHKVLLFSQSRQMLYILENFLISNNYSYLRMDGTTSIGVRQRLIKDFNENSSIFTFLLTTRVGGLGVNLTGADRVLIYDPDWNPSTDTQARERAWRIGQTKPVTIYRLLTAGTIEEKVYHRQIFKQFLTNRVLRDPRQRRFFKSNDLYELFTLGSSEGPHKTETSAMIAGTDSEIKLPRKGGKRKRGSSHSTSTPSLHKKAKNQTLPTLASNRTPSQLTTGELTTSQLTGTSSKAALAEAAESFESTGTPTTSTTDTTTVLTKETVTECQEIKKDSRDSQEDTNEEAVREKGTDGKGKAKEMDACFQDEGAKASTAELNEEAMEMMMSSQRRKKKKKKSKRKKRKKQAEVEGHHISGVESIDAFNPGSEDEENATNNRQDDFILRKLFKKSGVQTALKHDTLIEGGDPDSIIVESEANRIAQSAARALRESCRQCQGGGGGGGGATWGQPTWTGQHGTVGAPKFGEPSIDNTKSTKAHFTGASNASEGEGSLTLSSSVLLRKMRSRNALSLPETGSGLHTSGNSELLRELRSFVATQAGRPGKATTKEILGKFGGDRLSPADSVVFRSMLHQICDFERYHGDGLWSLKADYR